MARINKIRKRAGEAIARRVTRFWSSELVEESGLRGPRIRSIEEGEALDTSQPRVLLYAHYSPTNRITELVQNLLAEYRELGFNVVLITMSEPLAKDLRAAAKHCALIIRRRSFGRDFGAWKDAWPEVRRRFPTLGEVVLTNDSVLGPFLPLAPVCGKLRAMPAGISGITDSWDKGYHLQSYFLLFHGGEEVIGFLDRFMDTLRLTHIKKKMIRRGEIALSRSAIALDIPLTALCDYHAVVEYALTHLSDEATLKAVMNDVWRASSPRRGERVGKRSAAPDFIGGESVKLAIAAGRLRGTALNPTLYFWDSLIAMGCPFIKAELLLCNPKKIANTWQWREVALLHGQTPPDLIEGHLKACDSFRVP